MLQPKRTKYRKFHKGRVALHSKRGNSVVFGSYGLKAIAGGRVCSQEIESARLTMMRYLRSRKIGYKIWVRIFPDLSVTKKPIEVRMGKGKGSHEFWAVRVAPGRVIFEVDGVDKLDAQESLRKASVKLSLKTMYVSSLY